MNFKKCFIILVLVLMAFSCAPKWAVVESSSTKIPIDSTTERLADKTYLTYIQPFTAIIDEQMNVVIGQAAETMTAARPESLLSNFASEVLRDVASAYLADSVDIGIMNMGGLRAQITKGNITIRNVFELMPFENELVIVWLRGDSLMQLIQEMALQGGQGEAGIRMGINNRQPQNVLVGGLPIDSKKLYSIATNDFLAGGNDKLFHLAAYEKRENTGLTIREVMLNFIKQKTAKNEQIESKLDGRIYLIEN